MTPPSRCPSPLARVAPAAVLLVSLAACGPRSAPPATTAPTASAPRLPSSETVGEVSSLRFRSAFWVNLHHVLYAEAWARRAVPPSRSLAGVLPSPLHGEVSAAERASWEHAVAYYDEELASKDLLFDEAMYEIGQAMAAATDGRTPSGL